MFSRTKRAMSMIPMQKLPRFDGRDYGLTILLSFGDSGRAKIEIYDFRSGDDNNHG